MKVIACLLLVGFISIFWYLNNVFNKPVLNRMKNFYEEDLAGKSVANFFILLIIILSFLLGTIIF